MSRTVAVPARLRTALDAMLEGVTVTTAMRDEAGRIVDFRIDYSNPAIGEITSVPAADQIGHTLLGLFPAHRTNGLFDAYVRVVESGTPFESGAFRYVDPGAAGAPLDQVLEHRAAKLGDGYVLSVRDITGRHRVGLERERLVAAVEQSADGVVITDPDLRIAYANAAYAGSVGHEPSELIGRPATEVAAIGLDPATVAAMHRTVSAGRRWVTEVDHRFPDGSLHRFETNIGPIRDPAGAITSWVGVIRDITEHHQAEREMRRLSTAIEQSSDAVVITDAAGTIQYVNPAFEQVTGYTAAEALGQNPRILKSGVQGPAFYAAMWATLTSGQSFVGDLTNKRKDGSLFEEEAVISPIRDEAGNITSYVAVKRDVTRERALEAASERVGRERALIATTLASLQSGPNPGATAELICRQIASLAGVASATLAYFTPEGPSMTLAFVRADGLPGPIRRIPFQRSRRLRERAEEGPWVEAWVHRPWHPYDQAFAQLGVRAQAFAPLRHRGALIGLLVATSAADNAVAELTESLPALLEFAGVASALMGPDITELTKAGEGRARIAEIIRSRAFAPVFQPVVEIATGVHVGYEALTRFADGTPPNVVFGDARAAGLEAELELATLEAAIAAAATLPDGAWLSLNVSPSLVTTSRSLARVLGTARRSLVLEVTEHVTVDDYAALRAALGRIRPAIRVAVDDAGAGVANFNHIVELGPAFVKLDIGLVRAIEADRTRQALVLGLLHFASESASQTIAEGVETEAELAALRALGVPFAQGYLLARPGPPEDWTTTS